MAQDPDSNDELRGAAGAPADDASSQALAAALKSSFGIIQYVMVALVLLFVFSGVFKVGPEQRAIRLHFGRPVGQGEAALYGPGLYWSFPYPIDDVQKISIAKVQQVTSMVGWYATTPEMEAAGMEPVAGPTLNPALDGYALTADGNIVHTRATLTYRIQDPVRFIFGFVSASNAIQNTLDEALLSTAASFKVDDILTGDVVGYSEAVRRRFTQLEAQRQLGVAVDQCTVRSIPPRQLKDAFANVLKAEVKRSQVLNEARSYENQTLSKASADADGKINIAKSDRVRLVNEISSRAEQFRDLLPKYSANPDLFVQQRLSETLSRVLTNVQDKIFIAERPDGKSRELRLLLNREPVKPKSEGSNP
jgi:membrane protease subunit HflK